MSIADVRIITKTNRKALAVGIGIALLGQIPTILASLQSWLVIVGPIVSAVCTVAGIFQSLKIQTIDLSRAYTQTLTDSITNAAGVVTHSLPQRETTTR